MGWQCFTKGAMRTAWIDHLYTGFHRRATGCVAISVPGSAPPFDPQTLPARKGKGKPFGGGVAKADIATPDIMAQAEILCVKSSACRSRRRGAGDSQTPSSRIEIIFRADRRLLLGPIAVRKNPPPCLAAARLECRVPATRRGALAPRLALQPGDKLHSLALRRRPGGCGGRSGQRPFHPMKTGSVQPGHRHRRSRARVQTPGAGANAGAGRVTRDILGGFVPSHLPTGAWFGAAGRKGIDTAGQPQTC